MQRLNDDHSVRSVSQPPSLRLLALSIGCAAVLALSACGKKDADAQGGAPQQPPPAEVGVVTVTPGDVGLVTELPGRLEASRVAEVRARAAGILQKRLFTEGSDVKAGQALFAIDNAPYRATLESAQASVAQAEANVAQTRALAERYKPLVAVNAVSKQEYDNAVASQKTAEANLAAAKASVTTARINLGYASVTSPISGRIGRALVTEGALVGQGEPTQLAVVQQIDPLYVNFTQSASDALKLKAALTSGKYKQAGNGAAGVSVVLEDGSVYGRTGRLLFTDLTVDATSGQVTLRAEIPNPDRQLLPGLYVRVRVEQAQVGNGVLLPQQAVTRSAKGDTVMVVGEDNHLTPRPIKLGPAQGTNWVVLEGLKAGEKVMVDGFQKLPRGKPGDPIVVKPVPWQPAGAKPAAAPASAASAPAKQ
ncbi:efflux RND transporter periplasmic adaptor subunit [Paracidovorax wautersii]|uniref:Membrane fusion protein (Multidrug efflux system) n=1 Tax=Paracidovorax wautersii TaxID=1177982 RepID=A0ABU1I7K6_9BURK|nr:efflux RND transporter periplasmic adaptor subunit [Paracidovorax wautersii]MDR6213206.1 membrane fusion protein (multidrug efflux system) [Paracidovorax wautersii]